MTDALFLLPLLVLLLFWTWNSAVGFVFALVTQLALQIVGFQVMSSEGQVANSTKYLYGASVCMLLVGFTAGRRLRYSGRPLGAEDERNPLPNQFVWSVVLLAGVLALYHLTMAGVPILSDSIERARFDFTSSGFFGIPGRMYLFGTSIAWMVSSANACMLRVPWSAYRPWRWASGFVLICSLASGLKGALLSVLVMGVGVFVICTGVRIKFSVLVRRFWWVGVLGLSYFVGVASLYDTYKSSGESLWSQLIDRFTVVPAQPASVALEGLGWDRHQSVVLNDLNYFFVKYSGGSVDGLYSLDRSISSWLIGVDPTSTAWAPPVTVGGFAEAVLTVGPVGGLVLMFAVGWAFAWTERGTARSAIGLTTRALIGFVLYTWVLKGGAVYLILNNVVVFGGLLACATTSTLLLSKVGSGRVRPASRPRLETMMVGGSRDARSK